ncbi:hypothetical protein D9M70_512360 [compost metagenome]
MGDGRSGVDGAGADDDRNTGLDQALDAFHALRIGQERPVTHRAAIDDGGHALSDQLLALAYQRVEIGGAVFLARGHQRRDDAGENLSLHLKLLSALSSGQRRTRALAFDLDNSRLYFICRQEKYKDCYNAMSSLLLRAKSFCTCSTICSACALPRRSAVSMSRAAIAAMIAACSSTKRCGNCSS